ncbi:hypothetical protein BZA77DRAFT_315934 [Pyronema omphalodes]|nr:hypothetical protein BZA77DRAFT_315934 [Pyronema omphalodes]
MTELSFSREFLKLVSNRPQHLTRDYVQDPRTLPAAVPYTLAKTLPPPPKRQCIESGNATASLTLTLKPLRPTPGLSPQLITTTPNTTISSLKKQYSKSINIDISRLKLLLKAKPLSDVKTIAELGLVDGAVVTVMLMAGGGAAPGTGAAAAAAAAAGDVAAAAGDGSKVEEKEEKEEKEQNKKKVLSQTEFWDDLKKFLEDKLSSDALEQPEEVLSAFRKAWKA